MKRKLLKQIGHEWRSNLWLAFELLVISIVLWYIADFLSVQIITLNEPMGRHTENCYLISYDRVQPGSDGFNPADSTRETYIDNWTQFIDRLRSYPDIEELAQCNHLGVPYRQNSWNVSLTGTDGTDTIYLVNPSVMYVTPDYIRMFRITGPRGESTEQLAKILESGSAIISGNTLKITEFTNEAVLEAVRNRDTADLYEHVGKRFICPAITETDSITIGAIMLPTKRIEYEHPGQNILIRLDPLDFSNGQECIVRVKADRVDGFEERILADSEDRLRVGNFFISDVMSLTSIRNISQADYRDKMVNHWVVMLFLLASIFLGLLGTFWFRTQQRVSEIAIRKVNGASSAMIMRRLIGEGLLLLVIVTPLAIAGDWLLCHFELNTPIDWYGTPVSPLRFLLLAAIVFATISLMIILGIWLPATRAMRIDPATALKDE
jgi:putative ABC transport system permease protein